MITNQQTTQLFIYLMVKVQRGVFGHEESCRFPALERLTKPKKEKKHYLALSFLLQGFKLDQVGGLFGNFLRNYSKNSAKCVSRMIVGK